MDAQVTEKDKCMKGKGEEISKEVMIINEAGMTRKMQSLCVWEGCKNLMTCASKNFKRERKNNCLEVAVAAGRMPLPVPSSDMLEVRCSDCWMARSH